LDTYDYVIVGAGSAGSVLANRLTADGKTSVCVLEAGPRDWHPYIHIPAGFIKTYHDPRVNWLYSMEPGPWTGGRRILAPRGKTLGGSSSINGHIYNRGQPMDFDTWSQMGNRGWGYADVLPYFRRMERRVGDGDATFRGREGNLTVTDTDWRHPLCDAFIAGAVEAGIPRNPDYNGKIQEGVAYAQRTIQDGRRMSAARAFLHPAMKRGNLRVITHAHSTNLVLEGKRAVGVRYLKGGRGGAPHEVRARREVILSAGSYNSPQLLQLSGIGPAGLLARHGIAVLADASEVGRNLQDHYQARVIVKLKEKRSLNDDVRNPLRLAQMAADWLFAQRGPLTVGAGQVGGLVASEHARGGRADVLLNVMPLSVDKPGDPLHRFSGFSASAAQCRPESTGSVEIASADPLAPPRIRAGYLTQPLDAKVLVAGLRMLRKIYAQPAFRGLVTGEEYLPGNDVTTDAGLEAFARERGGTVFHPAGTCRMGGDARSVVDERLRVRGVERLRVIDASVMPRVVSTNTNAAAIMIGEKGAALVLEDASSDAAAHPGERAAA
jgi:choline dehydrogenase